MNNIESIKNKSKCLIIGDIMLDKYVYGKYRNTLSETSAKIFQYEKEKNKLGGAANVAKNIKNLNNYTYLCGLIGCDNSGKTIEKILKDEKIKFVGIKDKKITTITKMRCLINDKQILRLDSEREYSDNIQRRMLDNIRKIIKKVDYIILSDYCKGIFTEDFTQKIIKIALKFNKNIIVNSKSKNIEKFKGSNTISFNFSEFCDVINKKIERNNEYIQKEAINLLEYYNLENIIVTKDKDGITYINKENTYNLVSNANKVSDVSGAGDTVIAVYSNCISKKINKYIAIQIANIAAGIAIGKKETSQITLRELEKAILIGGY